MYDGGEQYDGAPYDGAPYDGAGRYDGAPYDGAGRFDGAGRYDGAGGGAANANALFSGGGFMPSQSTAVPQSSGGGGLSKGRSAQGLLPLTVKQIMDAAHSSDDMSNFAVNGVEVSTVRFVGRVLNKTERITDVAFILDDGTGRIDVNHWCEPSVTKEMADVSNGNYVIVNGGVKGFQGKRHVIAYSVRRVTDFNDVTHHFLHCIHVHLQLTRTKPHVNANIGNVNPPNQLQPSNNQAPVSGNTAGNNLSSLVLSVFNDPEILHLEDGVSMEYVINRLKNVPKDAIREAVEKHVVVGNVYSTIDGNHFRSIVNG